MDEARTLQREKGRVDLRASLGAALKKGSGKITIEMQEGAIPNVSFEGTLSGKDVRIARRFLVKSYTKWKQRVRKKGGK